jgi:hypothetical protein
MSQRETVPPLELAKRRFFEESVREMVREALRNKDAGMSRVKCKQHLAPQFGVDWFELNHHRIPDLITQFMLDRTRVGEKRVCPETSTQSLAYDETASDQGKHSNCTTHAVVCALRGTSGTTTGRPTRCSATRCSTSCRLCAAAGARRA